ncbi:hypothetical protein QIW46_27450, partial [Pseudomonas fluorescens]|uniref:hypothetical protein n=1 Tax=Pseudomonas fluorescens TaxID=294 RepID=UPI00352435F7
LFLSPGAGLGVLIKNIFKITHRHREQAHSYMGFAVFLRGRSCSEINCSYTCSICAIFSRLAPVGVV